MPTDRKRAYRYRLTDVGGSMVGRVKTGEHLIDWTYFGRGHTWTVFDFKRGKESGFMRGVYVDKGHALSDGKYEPDQPGVSGAD